MMCKDCMFFSYCCLVRDGREPLRACLEHKPLKEKKEAAKPPLENNITFR